MGKRLKRSEIKQRASRRRWKKGYRSTGTAKRIVLGQLRACGVVTGNDWPSIADLVKLAEKHLGPGPDERYRRNAAKLVFYAEKIFLVPHVDPEDHERKPRQNVAMRQHLSRKFLMSPEWHAAREIALERHGRRCMRCRITDKHAVITVDHIQPRTKRPDLALEQDNLQVLCRTCNSSKGWRDETDYRPEEEMSE